MNANEPQIKHIIAELIASFEGSLEIIVGAVARSGDADKLHAALLQQITIAESGKLVSPLAIHLATSALAVVEAVRLENQANDPDQHKH
ncbi:MAG: hypothetical protein K2P74_01620 [Nitrosomonas sp.]|nr:hypothetical protein [Nitrosomonas sp.]